MNSDSNLSKPNAEPVETDPLLAEVDGLIVSAEGRIQEQRRYIHGVASNFEARMKGISKLEAMTVALDKLIAYRARLTAGYGRKV